ncbi:DUF1330 domain-containing protein [Edaphobacter aggregans]|uniref:DUF1330 domain-containing protein n=1 Tax=Edaphobacter aggregans TaxID=570835 RepID=UPI003CCB88B0
MSERLLVKPLAAPGSAVTAHEAGLKQMTVVVEFDSYEAALAAFESEDYKKALAALWPEVERDFRITEGAWGPSLARIQHLGSEFGPSTNWRPKQDIIFACGRPNYRGFLLDRCISPTQCRDHHNN